MGMGSAPCHAWTIKREDVAKLCPQEFAALDAAISGEWDAFALAMSVDDTQEQDILEKWDALQRAFKQVTDSETINGLSSLDLSIDYYSRDDGDRYDDLETGCYFAVDGVTELTSAGKRFQEYLTESSWTVFG